MRTIFGFATAASTVMVMLASAPAGAAACAPSYDENGFPLWSGACPSTMSPGRFGPLVMGETRVADARADGLVAVNDACGGRLDGVTAYDNWRRKKGVVVAWSGRKTAAGKWLTTSKGLKPNDSLARARSLYPKLTRTGYLPIPYTPGTGWDIYSVRAKAGWLDVYVHEKKSRYNFFAVREPGSTKPIKSWSLDGC